MAYKFFQGTFKTDGILDVNNAVTGNSLLVDTGGISVTNGNIVATTSQLTASSVSASSAQFGSITVPTLSSTNLDLAGYLDVKGATRLSGNVGLGSDSADIVTVAGQLTASAGLSSSLGIAVGGGATFAGAVVINGATTNVQTLTASQGISASLGIQAGGSSIFSGLNANGPFNTFGTATMQGVTVKAGDLIVQDGSAVEKARISNSAGNISGSGTLQAGGNTTIAGTLTVNAALASTFANRVNVGKDGGGLSVSGSGQLQIAGIKNYEQELRSINQKIVVRDGGDANDKALLDGSGQVSGSGALNIGGAGIIAGNFTVNGVQTTVQQLTASFSTLGAAKVTSLSSSGNVIVAGDLQVNGTTTYVNSTNMTVTDKKLVIATGSANAAAADGAGIYVGNDNGIATDQYAALSYDSTGDLWNMTSTNGLDLATAGQVVKFEGTTVLEKTKLFGGAVTGSASGVGLKLAATEKTANYTVVVSDYVVAVDTATASGPVTITLPAAEVGRVYLIKDSGGSASSKNITVQRAGSDTIDGANSVPLQSDYAAVSVVCVAAGKWSLF